MSAAVQPFAFPGTGQQVRTVVLDDEPWFVGRDVALVLGYANPHAALAAHVPDRHRGVSRFATPSGEQDMTVISEPGMYRLIMRSNTELADRFQEWVTAEVLPALRRTGSYSVVAMPTHAQALRGWAAEIEAREAAERRAAELAPAADAWGVLASAQGDYSVREAAQILDRDPAISTGQNRLFAYMRQIGWLDREGQPYQAQVETGRLARRATSYTHPRTGEQITACQVRVTVKGLHALRDRLGGQATLPAFEGVAA
jgi:anti-repressor protein